MKPFSLTLVAGPAVRDDLIAELWEAGTTGITEEDEWLRAFFDASADPAELLERFRNWKPHVEEQDDRDWVEYSRSLWHPVAAGERFWLTPEWISDPAPAGRMRLPMRPGLACGSGWHAATQLSLEGMEHVVKPGASVLDVGTGTGILAEAAHLLGASVVACDIDASAAAVAHENLPDLPLFIGSVRSVRDGSFDILVANLNAATLNVLGRDLPRIARDAIVVSGFREQEQDDVALSVGRKPALALEQDGWACLVFLLAEI